MKKLLLALTLTAFTLAPLVYADEASEQDSSSKWHGRKPNIDKLAFMSIMVIFPSTGEPGIKSWSSPMRIC